MTINKFDNRAIDLSQSSFGEYVSEYSFEEALANGLLLNVTSWVRHEMGFGTNRYVVQVAVTARLSLSASKPATHGRFKTSQ
jgi:hypothetical protein